MNRSVDGDDWTGEMMGREMTQARDREPADVSDEILVLRSQLGDRVALNQLVERWHEPVWQLLRHITLDPIAADELAQETWLAALRGLGSLRQPERFRWWLFTIARRRATDRLRGRYRRRHTPEASTSTPGEESSEGGPDPMALVEDRELVIDALDDLEPGLRQVLVLHYLYDWPLHEIAALVEVPEGTVKSRLHRARRQARPTTTEETI